MSEKGQRRRVVRGELEGVDLGDERRSRRAVGIAERLAEQPDVSLPAAMGDRAWSEALYRHLAGDRVTLKALVEPHIRRTVGRVAAEEVVYAISDTTDFMFSGAALREGLGRINKKDQGFLAHVTLAVAPDRRPLGLLGVQTWVRGPKKASTLWTRRNEARESEKWARGIRAAHERAGDGAGCLVHVADREGDIYELLAELVGGARRFIIRAGQDRALLQLDAADERRLFNAAQATPTSFVAEVPLSARAAKRTPEKRRAFPARRERQATLSFAARTVAIKRSRQRSAKLPPTVTVNIVHVFELGPPPGEPPVEWILLTSEPVETRAQVEQIVAGYRTRWVIEEYFKAIKTGCAYESRQLESAHTLQALLGFSLLVAYSLLLMRSLSRLERDEPAEAVLSPAQLLVLRAKTRNLPQAPTVRVALLAVAGLGGHFKNNGDPGWQTLSKGWARLLALEEGYALAKALAEK
jgi:Transposase DNA-binding/Transposase DDE domain